MLTPVEMIFSFFVGIVPTINVPIITLPIELYNIINVAWYFLPMQTIFALLVIGLVITLVRFAIACVLRFKSFIPFSGGA